MCHVKLAQRLPDRFLANPEPGGTLILIRIGMLLNILNQLFRINPAHLPALIRPGLKPLRSTLERGDACAKTSRCFFKSEPFFLSDSKDMAAEWNRVGHKWIVS